MAKWMPFRSLPSMPDRPRGLVAPVARMTASNSFKQPVGGIVFADFRIGQEGDALLLHLMDAAVYQFFAELHVRDAVGQQAADAVAALKDASPDARPC